MCWSPTVSINTFLISIIATSAVFYSAYFLDKPVDGVNAKNVMPFTFFMLSFVTIQLFEYNLWNNLDNPNENQFWSMLAFFLIFIQPFASINRMERSVEKTRLLIYYMIFFLAVILFLLPSRVFETHKGFDGHLHWTWLDLKGAEYIFLFAWIALFFTPYYYIESSRLAGILGAVTLIFSIYYYSIGGSWGSMWCWIANIISIYYIVKIILENQKQIVAIQKNYK